MREWPDERPLYISLEMKAVSISIHWISPSEFVGANDDDMAAVALATLSFA
jgi:hypothetical protein